MLRAKHFDRLITEPQRCACLDKCAKDKTIYFCDVGRIGAGPKGNAHLQYLIFHCADVES
jgi:hypothetical protein